MHDTVVWITGATGGLGAGLAATVPFEGARVVNLSRRPHPDVESVHFDLTDPASWDAVEAYLADELSRFEGTRAILVHNAVTGDDACFAGEGDRPRAVRHALGDAAGSLVLGDAFIRHCPPELDSGLVMVSSAAGAFPVEGRAIYGAAKAGVEQWVRVVQAERRRRGRGPWVLAVRPGTVDSPLLRAQAEQDPHDYPIATGLREAYAAGRPVAPEVAARAIWALMPPDPDADPVRSVGPPTTLAEHGARLARQP